MKTSQLMAIALGFCSFLPAIAPAILPQPAAAQTRNAAANDLQGNFGSSDMNIGIYYRNNTYNYYGYSRGSGSIDLSGATVRRDGARKIYTWNNGGTRYQVVWQPQDPDFIRVRVTTPQGREILNRLLSRQEDGC